MILPHSVQHKLAELAGVGVPEPDGPAHRGLQRRVVKLVEHVAVPVVRMTCGIIAVEDRVRQAADGPHDGDGAVLERDYLAQPARLEQAGHHQHVGTGVDQVGQAFLEPDFQVTVGVVIQVALQGKYSEVP